VALATHVLICAMAGLFWLRARGFRQNELADLGDYLPPPTQLLYDLQLPPALLVVLVLSLLTAVWLRRSAAALAISTISVVAGALAIGVFWWAMRLPLTVLAGTVK
jgi:hypothetical protein